MIVKQKLQSPTLTPVNLSSEIKYQSKTQPLLANCPRVIKPMPKRFARGFHNPSWLTIKGPWNDPKRICQRFSLRSLRTISVSPPLSPVSSRIPVPRSVACLDAGYDQGYQQPQTGHHQPPPHPCTAPYSKFTGHPDFLRGMLFFHYRQTLCCQHLEIQVISVSLSIKKNKVPVKHLNPTYLLQLHWQKDLWELFLGLI